MDMVNTVFSKLQPLPYPVMVTLLVCQLYYYLLILRKYVDWTPWLIIAPLPQAIILMQILVWKASSILNSIKI